MNVQQCLLHVQYDKYSLYELFWKIYKDKNILNVIEFIHTKKTTNISLTH